MPKIVECTTLHSGYLTVQRLKIALDNGTTVIREVESHGEAVAGLAYDTERGCVLTVRLLRAPLLRVLGEGTLEEACAGMIEGDETAEASMRREACEELGLQCRSVECIGRVWSTAGVSTERVSLYLIPYTRADRAGAGGGIAAENEGITVVERSWQSLLADAQSGNIGDAKLLTLTLALAQRLT